MFIGCATRRYFQATIASSRMMGRSSDGSGNCVISESETSA
jgi:hypothetical protein